MNFDNMLTKIIDELDPNYIPISDEICIEINETCGIFVRDFCNKIGKKMRVKWKVYFGTPETVKTIFLPIINI